MATKQAIAAGVLFALLLPLAACQQQGGAAGGASNSAGGQQGESSASDGPLAAVAPGQSGTEGTEVLSADKVNVQLSLAAEPTLSDDGKNITVEFTLANRGQVALLPTGAHPINAGAHSVDTDGKIVNRDLARAGMKAVQPGAQIQASIALPVDQVVGYAVQILPVQEGVAWFDAWGTKPLVVGPFSRCSGAAAAQVCSANGKPLIVK